MADWETAGAGDGVAVPQDSSDAHQENSTFDTNALVGALNEADEAAFKDKAQEAGWVGTIPVNYNVQQSNREDELAAYAASSAVYEWDDEYGDVGPEVPQLEEQLFNNAFRLRQGKHMANLQLEVTVEGPNKIHPVRSFDKAGLHPVVEEVVTKKMGYNQPTPIQAYTIPAVLSGSDVIAIAQTGSGKTAAYLIPIISRLCGKAKKLCARRPNPMRLGFNLEEERVKAEPLVVIVVPTHELAVQVFDECRRLCYRTMLRPFATYGGQPMGVMFQELAKGCDILVATTGRLVDLMGRPEVLTMSRVRYTVIDEADEMLSPDWEEHMKTIMAGGDTNDDADHIYLMFSATFPKELRSLARQYMEPGHYRLTVGRAGSSHKNIAQDVIFVGGNKKLEACFDLLYSSEPVRTLIFCNSKRTVDELDAYLYQRHLPSTSIHSDRGQREREDSMRAFRSGRAPILIATGVTARGLDVAGIEHVINYDLPSTMFGGIHEYVHRIGRTARIGNTGKATSFYDERRDEEIGPALVKTMLEAGCTVPEFLAHLVPDDGVVTFEDDESDEEGEGEPEADADADAGGAAVDSADASFAASAWGAAAPDADADAGFAAVPDNAWGAAAAAAPAPEASSW